MFHLKITTYMRNQFRLELALESEIKKVVNQINKVYDIKQMYTHGLLSAAEAYAKAEPVAEQMACLYTKANDMNVSYDLDYDSELKSLLAKINKAMKVVNTLEMLR